MISQKLVKIGPPPPYPPPNKISKTIPIEQLKKIISPSPQDLPIPPQKWMMK